MKHELNQGAFIKERRNDVMQAGNEKVQMSVYDFALKGKHNQYNTMAAGVAAATIGITKGKDKGSRSNF